MWIIFIPLENKVTFSSLCIQPNSFLPISQFKCWIEASHLPQRCNRLLLNWLCPSPPYTGWIQSRNQCNSAAIPSGQPWEGLPYLYPEIRGFSWQIWEPHSDHQSIMEEQEMQGNTRTFAGVNSPESSALGEVQQRKIGRKCGILFQFGTIIFFNYFSMFFDKT